MATCLVELFMWHIQTASNGREADIGFHVYHDKDEIAPGVYLQQRQQHDEGRDIVWTPRNRRPDKLRDILKEMEEQLASNHIVFCKWRSRRQLQVLLGSGVIILAQIAAHSGDVEKILVDKSFQGKLGPEPVSQAVIKDNFLAYLIGDKSKLGLAFFNKKPSTGDTPTKLDKVSNLDPKHSQLDLPGPQGNQVVRKLSVNSSQEWVMVWWYWRGDEVAGPWAPLLGDKDKANIHIFALNGSKLEEHCFGNTERKPIDVSFSAFQARRIHSLEEVQGSARQGHVVECCIYEVSANKIQRITFVQIPVPARVVHQARSHSERRLLLACQDGRLVLFDESKRVTQQLQVISVPKHVVWHPEDTILVTLTNTELKVYDLALNALQVATIGEDFKPYKSLNLGLYYRSSSNISHVSWSEYTNPMDSLAEPTHSLALAFEFGPLALLQFHAGILSRGKLSPHELIKQYLMHQEFQKAVRILEALNWNVDSSSCFMCLSTLMNRLLAKPLTPETEAVLQTCLGTFYAPIRPISDLIVVEYRNAVSRLARRFFHHLLRYQRFEKAFLLAVDLHDRDLFMDLYFVAVDKGEKALAAVSRKKAEEIETELPSTSETDQASSLESGEDVLGSGSDWSDEDSEEGDSDLQEGASGPINREATPGRRRVEQEAWFQAELQIDDAYKHGSGDEDNDLDDSKGLAGIPGDVYTQILQGNPYGWDVPDNAEEEDATGEDEDDEPEESPAQNLKVIHFGMV